MKRSCSQLCLNIAWTKSHLGLSQHESGIRRKEWFPQPQIRNQCPLIQPLLLSVVPGVQAESKELFWVYAASAEARIRCSFEVHPVTQLLLLWLCTISCNCILVWFQWASCNPGSSLGSEEQGMRKSLARKALWSSQRMSEKQRFPCKMFIFAH